MAKKRSGECPASVLSQMLCRSFRLRSSDDILIENVFSDLWKYTTRIFPFYRHFYADKSFQGVK